MHETYMGRRHAADDAGVVRALIGVQRNAISIVAHALQQAGIISYSRGRIEIMNDQAIQETACECYGTRQGKTRTVARRSALTLSHDIHAIEPCDCQPCERDDICTLAPISRNCRASTSLVRLTIDLSCQSSIRSSSSAMVSVH
jgi:hypothetical protein